MKVRPPPPITTTPLLRRVVGSIHHLEMLWDCMDSNPVPKILMIDIYIYTFKKVENHIDDCFLKG